LGAASLAWILKRGINLASLRIPRGIVKAEQQSIRHAIAALVINGSLDKLETVSFPECSYIADADFAAILSKCYSSVKSINLAGCSGLTESSAEHIKRCTNLEAFTPTSDNESAMLTDKDMVEIVKACKKLRKLCFNRIGDLVTDEVVQSVAAHCHLLGVFRSEL
jgi:hypothetical protein